MTEYYNIQQLTGKGYEILLDAVDSTMLACFYNGTMVCVGDKRAMEGQDEVETLTATVWEAA